MSKIAHVIAALASLTFVFISAPVLINMDGTLAFAGQSCKSGYYYSRAKKACVKRVKQTVAKQDANAAGGPQWGPPNKENCAAASSEMDSSMALCRGYDIGTGKSDEQCAKCCRQLREGTRRWQQCHSKGFAPAVDWATINRSKERLGCTW